MACNSVIHDELKNKSEPMCYFCCQLFVVENKAVELCCSGEEMENIDGMNVCRNCGLVYGYVYVDEKINFYENMYRIRRKSIYNRKYHIDNVLNSISEIQFTHHQRKQIHKVFAEINKVLNEINDGRKRIISIKYIIKELFKMLGLPYKDINVTKSKRTLSYYKQFWKRVLSLIGNRIQSIINL